MTAMTVATRMPAEDVVEIVDWWGHRRRHAAKDRTVGSVAEMSSWRVQSSCVSSDGIRSKALNLHDLNVLDRL